MQRRSIRSISNLVSAKYTVTPTAPIQQAATTIHNLKSPRRQFTSSLRSQPTAQSRLQCSWRAPLAVINQQLRF